MNNVRVLLLVGGAVGLLVVTAGLTPETGATFSDGNSQDLIVTADTPVLLDYLMLFLTALVFSAVLFLRASARRRVAPTRRLVSPWRRAVVLLILLALWVTFPGVQTLVTDVLGELRNAGAALGRAPGSSAGLREAVSSRLAGYVLTGAFALLIVGLGLLVLWLWHNRPAPEGPRTSEESVIAGIDAGLEDLSSIKDPRAAVIACYVRMLKAAGDAGVERRTSDTPFEALHRLLDKHGVTEPSARRLTLLFERARFSNHDIDETMRTEALDALLEIRSELSVPA